jgi:hypothetical protein
LTVAFDYKILKSGSNNLVPEMILGSNATGGIFVVLWSNGNFGYQGPSGQVTPQCSIALDTWYHVSVAVNVPARTVSTTLTPFGGNPTTYQMAFRTNINNVTGVSFVNNTGAGARGSWAIDNVTFTPDAP